MSSTKAKRDQPIGWRWSLFAALICKILISPEAEAGESLAFPELLLHLEKECSFSFAFPFPSALSSVSFPIPSGASRIDSLL